MKPPANFKVVEIIYRDVRGTLQKKFNNWPRNYGSTNEALAGYMAHYFEMIEEDGYIPDGFTQAPRPHCARIKLNGQVLAEWHLSPTPASESHVTDARPIGPEASGATPSAPSSECLTVPMSIAPREKSIQANAAAIRRKSPGLIRDVLTMG